MTQSIHSIPHDPPNPSEPASRALDAFADQIPEHIATLSLEREDCEGATRLLLRYGIDARRLAQDPNAATDVLSFLERVSRGIHEAVGLVPTCVPVKLAAIG